MRIKLIIVSLIFCTTASAISIIDSILASQCIYYYKNFDWGCNSTSNNAKAYNCRCRNIDWIGSITNCFESQGNNNTDLIDHAYRHVRSRCITKAHLDWPVEVLKYYQKNATDFLVMANPKYLKNQSFHPLQVNETSFALPKRSFNHIYAQVVRSQAFQWGFVFYWGFVMILATLVNIGRIWLFKYLNKNRSKFTSNFINRLRFNLTIPNLFERSYVKLFGVWPVQIPTRLDSVIIGVYLIYMILASCVGYTIELPNVYQNGRLWQLLDLIGYRTGLNSFALIPMTFFFGIRNNPFIKLTGLSIPTFMSFHKWCAIGMTIQGLIHSAVWTHYTIREGDYAAWASDPYWQWGIVGTILTFLTLVQASLKFRELSYEFFLIIHQSFGIVFLISMWYHVNTIGWLSWIVTCIVIWSYDRLVRFLSILWNGGATMARATKLDDTLIEIAVKKPFHDQYYPGSFYYLYFLDFKTSMWQSHPFSIMKSKRNEGSYTIIFKSHKGITKKVEQSLSLSKKSKLMHVFLEGPYGVETPLNTHEQYVFLTAGIGFTPLYSQCVDIIERNELKSNKTYIKFVWVVRSLHHYQLFEKDFQYLLNNGVELQVYVTAEIHQYEEHYKHIVYNRPVVSELVTQTDMTTSTKFISCGPSRFTDESRQAVRELIKTSPVRVDYHEESFVM